MNNPLRVILPQVLSVFLCLAVFSSNEGSSADNALSVNMSKSAKTDTPRGMTTEEFNKKVMSEEEMTEFGESVNALGKKITADLKAKKMSGLDILSKASIFDFLSGNVNIQEATGISRDWYKKVSEQLKKLGQCKNAMEVSLEHKRNDLYKKYSSEYDTQLQDYLTLVRNPAKAKPKSVNNKQDDSE